MDLVCVDGGVCRVHRRWIWRRRREWLTDGKLVEAKDEILEPMLQTNGSLSQRTNLKIIAIRYVDLDQLAFALWVPQRHVLSTLGDVGSNLSESRS